MSSHCLFKTQADVALFGRTKGGGKGRVQARGGVPARGGGGGCPPAHSNDYIPSTGAILVLLMCVSPPPPLEIQEQEPNLLG